MKKWLLVIFTIICFFIVDNNVYADVNNTNAEIECIYANGIVIGMSYDKTAGKNTAYVKEYPVTKTAIIDGNPVSNVSLYSVNDTVSSLKNLSCPATVSYWIGWELHLNQTYDAWGNVIDEDVSKSYRGVYSYSNHAKVTESLTKVETSGWWLWEKANATAGTIPVTGTNIIKKSPYADILLVGERIYLVDDIGSDGYGHTYKLSTENEQAIGSSKYVQIYKGTNNYIQVGKVITKLEGANENAEYLCIEPSVTTQDSDRGETAYKFSSIRHKVHASTSKTCSSGQLYVRTTESCKTIVPENKESFCDRYSNTVFVLIDIIKIMQILVPAIVIIFTGIEIGRIVLAGNIEEELPKRKKSIFIRLIVMIAFFFLPTIVQLIVSLAEGVSILDVSCLFNDGLTINENEDLTSDNCVDDSNSDESNTDNSSSGSTSGGSSSGSTGGGRPGGSNAPTVEYK